jgi:pimeloyl-ACP methyl ester carboxylesterase
MVGNASSIPPRLPFLSPVLRKLRDRAVADQQTITYTFVCCSYRGYWKSRGRPSEKGIQLDAAATLKWIREQDNDNNNGEGCIKEIPVVLWGQSIGAGVATSLAAQQELFSKYGFSLKALILETPFLSIRAMLETLYPQKWLPYRHLWPFLRNHLDSWKSLGLMTDKYRMASTRTPKVWILEAERDELVPKDHGDMLERRCLELGLDVHKKVIGSALHTEVMVRSGGVNAVVEVLEAVAKDKYHTGISP